MIYPLALVFLGLLIFFSHRTRPYDTYLSAVSFFGASMFFYLVGIPLEMAITGNRYLTVAGTHLPVSESTALHIVLSAILGFVAFYLGYAWVRNRATTVLGAFERGRLDSKPARTSLLVVVVLGIGVLLFAFPGNLIGAGTYEGNVDVVASSSSYSLTLRWTMQTYAMWLFLGIGMREWRLGRALTFVAPLAAWGLYSSDKDPLVIAGLALSALYLRTGNRFKSAAGFGLTAIGGLLGLALATLAFSIYRGGGVFNISRHFERAGGFLTTIEPSGPMLSILRTIDLPTSEYLHGSSVLHSAYLWIPRSVWPGRPYDLAQEFASDTMPDWSPGRGYGYSLLSEGYLNGGDLGAIAIFFLVGLLFGLARNYLVSTSSNSALGSLKLPMLYVLLMYVAFTSLRGPISLIITSLVQSLGLYLGLIILALVFRPRSSKGTAEVQ